MVAVVATDEPQIAPNMVQAPIVAIATPPRRWPTRLLAAANSARLMPDCSASAPMRMNSGITDRV